MVFFLRTFCDQNLGTCELAQLCLQVAESGLIGPTHGLVYAGCACKLVSTYSLGSAHCMVLRVGLRLQLNLGDQLFFFPNTEFERWLEGSWYQDPLGWAQRPTVEGFLIIQFH